jgi:hypothetical protein
MGDAGDASLSPQQMDSYFNGTAGESNQTRPMGDEPIAQNEVTTTPEQPAPTPEQATKPIIPQDFEDEIIWGQKPVKLPYQKIKTYAQLGYNYSNNQRALNEKMAAVAAKEAESAKLAEYYKEIDNAAKQDPDWWNHVVTSYKSRGQTVSPTTAGENPVSQLPPELQAALSPILQNLQKNFDERVKKLEDVAKTVEQQALERKEASENAHLEEQIGKFKSTYPDFEWDTLDANGLLLEDRIIVHAHKNGINNFQAAARDMLWEDALKRHSLKGKEELTETLKRTRGVDGKFLPTGSTQNPQRPPQTNGGGLRPLSSTNLSYDDAVREGLAEFGLL